MDVYDVANDIQLIDNLVRIGLPELFTYGKSNISKALRFTKKFLVSVISTWAHDQSHYYPASLMVYMTYCACDELFDDSEPVIKEIQSILVPDGSVLIENICICNTIFTPLNINEPRDLYQKIKQAMPQVTNSLLCLPLFLKISGVGK